MNPLQKGCEVYTTAAASNGCASVGLFTNGYNGATVSLAAAQAGLGRHDRRTIFGARYEHDLTDNTTLGADWSLGATLQASITGFYEWFHNEMVTQSPGVNLQSFTFNAPASAHRGVKVGLDWHPLPGTLAGARLRASYMYDNQIYTNYSESITTGTITGTFNRKGNMIPGVVPNFLNARIIYDQPTGKLRGFGGFIEANWRDNYQLDNANLLGASSFTLFNLSTHYNPPAGHGAISRLRFYFDVQNLANKTYVASAGNITDSLNTSGQQNGPEVLATSTGSIYAGTPRASYGGFLIKF